MQAQNLLQNPRFSADKSQKVQVAKSDQLAADGLFLRGGQVHGPHRLPAGDRVFVCVSGTGELVLHTEPVDQRIELTPGMVALAPRGVWHAVVAKSDLVATVVSEFPVRVEERG